MWFYVHNEVAEGPVSEEILQRLLQTGSLPPDVLVWQEGRDSWVPAHSIFAGLPNNEGAIVTTTPGPAVEGLAPVPEEPPPPPPQTLLAVSLILAGILFTILMISLTFKQHPASPNVQTTQRTSALPPTPPPPSPKPKANPHFSITVSKRAVHITGSLPSNAAKIHLANSARTQFKGRTVSDQVSIDSRLSSPLWIEQTDTLVSRLSHAVQGDSGFLSINQQGKLTLTGSAKLPPLSPPARPTPPTPPKPPTPPGPVVSVPASVPGPLKYVHDRNNAGTVAFVASSSVRTQSCMYAISFASRFIMLNGTPEGGQLMVAFQGWEPESTDPTFNASCRSLLSNQYRNLAMFRSKKITPIQGEDRYHIEGFFGGGRNSTRVALDAVITQNKQQKTVTLHPAEFSFDSERYGNASALAGFDHDAMFTIKMNATWKLE